MGRGTGREGGKVPAWNHVRRSLWLTKGITPPEVSLSRSLFCTREDFIARWCSSDLAIKVRMIDTINSIHGTTRYIEVVSATDAYFVNEMDPSAVKIEQ